MNDRSDCGVERVKEEEEENRELSLRRRWKYEGVILRCVRKWERIKIEYITNVIYIYKYLIIYFFCRNQKT